MHLLVEQTTYYEGTNISKGLGLLLGCHSRHARSNSPSATQESVHVAGMSSRAMFQGRYIVLSWGCIFHLIMMCRARA